MDEPAPVSAAYDELKSGDQPPEAAVAEPPAKRAKTEHVDAAADRAAAAQPEPHAGVDTVAEQTDVQMTEQGAHEEASAAAASAGTGASEPAQLEAVAAASSDSPHKTVAGAADGHGPTGATEPLPTTLSKGPSSLHGKAAPSPKAQHKASTGDVVYRVLVPHRAVGIVIGKGGCNVRELQSTSGARVQVATAVPTCEEHVVVVSMPEDPEADVHGAEKALLALQRLLILELEPTAAAALDTLQQQEQEHPEQQGPTASQQAQPEQHAEHGDASGRKAVAAPAPSTANHHESAGDAPASGVGAGSDGEGNAGDAQAAAAAAAAAPSDAAAEAQGASTETDQVADGAGDAADPQPAAAGAEALEGKPAAPGTSNTDTAAAEAPAQEAPPAGGTAAAAAAASGDAVAGSAGAAGGTAEAAADGQGAAADQAEQTADTAEAAARPTAAPEAAAGDTAGEATVTQAATEPATPTANGAAVTAAPASQPAAKPAQSPAAPRMQHVARLLLGHSQSLSLLAHGAVALKAIKDASGARLQVQFPEDSPLCALEGDRVAQLTGRAEGVMRGLQLLARHLRQHPPLEKPGGMHPALAARIAAARRPPPPPPPPPRGYAPGAPYGAGPYPTYGVSGYGY